MADSPASLDVPAGELATALKALASQARVDLVYQLDQVKDIHTEGVKGKYSPQEAVSVLLKGTSLRVYATQSGAMVITTPRARTGSQDSSGTRNLSSTRSQLSLAQVDQETQSVANETPRAEKRNYEAANDQPARLEEIVVTAQKREQRLQDVPISISVLTGDNLDKSSFTGVTDALSLVPGVSASTTAQGGGTLLAVRGVIAGGPAFAGSSPIGYYVDSVPFSLMGFAIAPDFNAFDLQRIEVLRGPQGTLYGASSENGLVRVLTNDPDLNHFELKGRATGSYTGDGGSGNYRADTAINVPLIEGKLAARAVVGYESLSGWIHNQVEDHTNGADLLNVRLKIAAQLTDALSIGLSAWSTHNRYGAPSVADSNNLFEGPLSQETRVVTDAFGAKIGYTFDAFSVTSTTSYLRYYDDGLTDQSPTGFQSDLITNYRSSVTSEELLLTSNPGTEWRWSFGAFYRNDVEHDYEEFTVDPFEPPFSVTLGSSSTAIYGDVGHHFLGGKFEWAIGARYFHDYVQNRDDVEVPGVPLYRGAGTFVHTSPRATLSWYPAETTTLYATYSQGFRSGFPQFGSTFHVDPNIPPARPDKLDNYEIGAKGDLLDRKISYDAAVYYLKWRDIIGEFEVPFFPGSPQGTTAQINGTSASGVGFDLAITARPLEGLDIGVTGNWNNLSYDTDVPALNQTLFMKGDRLNYSPEYTVGAFSHYHFPIGGTGYSGTFAASANYIAKQYIHNSFGSVFINYGTSQTSVRTSFALASPHGWTATAFVDNLTNNHPDIPNIFSTLTTYDPRVRPRTIGLQIDYHLE